MDHFRRWVPSLFAVVVIFAFVVEVRGDYGNDETFHECGGGEYDFFSSYGFCVSQVLSDVARLTPTHGYNYIASSKYMGQICYGFGACHGALSNSECNQCILDATNNLYRECRYKVIGHIKLAKCRMGYQDISVPST